MAHVERRTRRRIHCPRCGVGCEWTGNPHRPFCSLECRLIDLGAWLDERYRVPGPQLSTDSESPGPGTPGRDG